jgi:CheY-like chemotaxis protein
MKNTKRTVLVLDDDEINLMILIKGVQEAGYIAKPFMASAEAWDFLQKNPHEIDIALLDKMMPVMDGIEMLKRIKSTESLRHIPVIIQTGDVGVQQMREGIEAGAYYYLTKPFHPEILTALLHSSAGECEVREALYRQIEDSASVIHLLQQGEFLFKTHEEARRICAIISEAALYPEFVVVGLMELLANAIEHGNLEFGYEKKHECMMNGTWEQEVAARHAKPEYKDRVVRLHFERTKTGLYLNIFDQGKGFDHRCQADHLALLKLNEPNGRGLAKALVMLDDVRFIDTGSEVHCNVKLQNTNCFPLHEMPQPKRGGGKK